ncbi:bifunctional 2-polyprenyl-6-hydroxyphenol methylase/3-demethylubiquinol 3-O-methyltransferase UbiG [uncultured Thiohalocapsa sp.]|uniref:class I SAM-dependent methyltransferase n=1 Tax=uncultured Thiohalocapsa sp. TaxID=768990 RepID=UPI0025FA065A|nr:class I SAM-dependent methyltransferase [uncultured Thiohalocapsa sp.]
MNAADLSAAGVDAGEADTTDREAAPAPPAFTGERYIPGTAGAIEFEHVHRYLLAADICGGKRVLDIACGEGYGSARLATVAAHVIGVDIAEDTVRSAQARYAGPNLEFLVGDCASIPVADDAVDVVVSFETIEHHDQHEAMLREIRRVLRPQGVLLISSPDRHNYSERPGTVNPFHVRELYEREFKALLAAHFAHTQYYGQRVCLGSLIFPQTASALLQTHTRTKDGITTAQGLSAPIFWLALASDGPLPALRAGLFEQPIEEAELVCLLRHDLQNAQILLEQRADHLQQAAALLQQKEAHLATAAELLKDKDAHLAAANERLARISALTDKLGRIPGMRPLLRRLLGLGA